MTTNLYPNNSRYYGSDTAQMVLADGRAVVYLRRRFVPSPDRFVLLMQYSVVAGDRLDTIAAQLLGDPQLFWRIADANGAMRPDELTGTIGRQLRITLPEGIPGAKNA
jgi:hypothetical protein